MERRRISQYVQSYSFPNILLDGWEGLKAYTFEKRQSKGAYFEKIFRCTLHMASTFKFASYAYALNVSVLLLSIQTAPPHCNEVV